MHSATRCIPWGTPPPPTLLQVCVELGHLGLHAGGFCLAGKLKLQGLHLRGQHPGGGGRARDELYRRSASTGG